MAIDFDFLREVEGFETEAYVPQDDNGVIENSGVTIGSGIDLGQWTKKQLADMGVDPAVLTKLEPYLGKKKDKALDLLNQQPLRLSEGEAEALTTAVKKGYAEKMKRWYNKNNTVGNDWSDLTDRQQTAVTSVAFQYGVGSDNTPAFNKQVLDNDWDGLAANLKNFGDRYDTRRGKELDYLLGGQPSQGPDMAAMGFLEKFSALLEQGATVPQRGSQAPESLGPKQVDRRRNIAERIAAYMGEGDVSKPKPAPKKKQTPAKKQTLAEKLANSSADLGSSVGVRREDDTED